MVFSYERGTPVALQARLHHRRERLVRNDRCLLLALGDGHTLESAGHTIHSVGHTMQSVGHTMQSVGHTMQRVGHTMQSVGLTMQSVGHTTQFRWWSE